MSDERTIETVAARNKRWASRWRCWLLRLALGRRTFEYMLRSIKADRRTPGARLVDIVVRQDGREERIEADWVKTIARHTCHLEAPPHRATPIWLRKLREWKWRLRHSGYDDEPYHGQSESAGGNPPEKSA